jgi:hypothetical protein
MRKDSINQDAIEKAYLIFKEHGHQIVDYDFSHPPTDYKRNTIEEPEATSKLRDAFNELLPANVMQGDKYVTWRNRPTPSTSKSTNSRISFVSAACVETSKSFTAACKKCRI